MIVVPFRAEHLFLIDAQEEQREELRTVTLAQAKSLEYHQSYTAIENGEVLFCGGTVMFHEDRILVWSYISAKAGKHFRKIHRGALKYLGSLPYNRVEMNVALGFEPGHRWAKLLGFELETPVMRKYYADGGDAAGYVRIR